MKKINLIKNPELFQGERYLKNNYKKNYFEGWYFKNVSKNGSISFIPGINIENGNKKAFIQIITDKCSYFVDYLIEDFKFSFDPFYIKIKDNYFSKEYIHIDINNQDIYIYGDINYSNNINIKTNFLNPNIMGIFSYIPFMECNHAILSMNGNTKGLIIINNDNIDFNDGFFYIEKDYGTSFPKSYIWCHGNNFKNKTASFMCSIADINFKIFNFRGIICVLIVDGIEYRFATYNKTKIIKYLVNDNYINIILKLKRYTLEILSYLDNKYELSAPVKGKMSKNIFESISSKTVITLKKDNYVIFNDSSNNCGLEIVI